MQKRRITFIDGLRGVAASLVLFGHVLEEFQKLHPTSLLDGVLDLAGFGRIGVIAFFCISGFVIPFSFRPMYPVRNFVISRFFRLYPAYWLSLGLAAAVAGGMSASMVLANLTMAPVLFGEPDAISVYWTLFIELLFYGACMGMFVLGLLDKTWSLALAALGLWGIAMADALAAFFEAAVQPPAGIPAYLGIMFLGSVWRRAWLEHEPVARRIMPLLAAVLLATIAVVGLFGFDRDNFPDRPLADFLGVYAGLALFFAAFPARRLLEGPLSIWLGNVSYSLYLLHPLAVLACSTLAALTGSPVVAALLLALSLPLALAMAGLSTRFVEQPAVRLGRYLSQQSLRRPPSEA